MSTAVSVNSNLCAATGIARSVAPIYRTGVFIVLNGTFIATNASLPEDTVISSLSSGSITAGSARAIG